MKQTGRIVSECRHRIGGWAWGWGCRCWPVGLLTGPGRPGPASAPRSRAGAPPRKWQVFAEALMWFIFRFKLFSERFMCLCSTECGEWRPRRRAAAVLSPVPAATEPPHRKRAIKADHFIFSCFSGVASTITQHTYTRRLLPFEKYLDIAGPYYSTFKYKASEGSNLKLSIK